MFTAGNSLEDWLELTILVSKGSSGADLVRAYNDIDHENGLTIGYGRRILESSIKQRQFYYAGSTEPEPDF